MRSKKHCQRKGLRFEVFESRYLLSAVGPDVVGFTPDFDVVESIDQSQPFVPADISVDLLALISATGSRSTQTLDLVDVDQIQHPGEGTDPGVIDDGVLQFYRPDATPGSVELPFEFEVSADGIFWSGLDDAADSFRFGDNSGPSFSSLLSTAAGDTSRLFLWDDPFATSLTEVPAILNVDIPPLIITVSGRPDVTLGQVADQTRFVPTAELTLRFDSITGSGNEADYQGTNATSPPNSAALTAPAIGSTLVFTIPLPAQVDAQVVEAASRFLDAAKNITESLIPNVDSTMQLSTTNDAEQLEDHTDLNSASENTRMPLPEDVDFIDIGNLPQPEDQVFVMPVWVDTGTTAAMASPTYEVGVYGIMRRLEFGDTISVDRNQARPIPVSTRSLDQPIKSASIDFGSARFVGSFSNGSTVLDDFVQQVASIRDDSLVTSAEYSVDFGKVAAIEAQESLNKSETSREDKVRTGQNEARDIASLSNGVLLAFLGAAVYCSRNLGDGSRLNVNDRIQDMSLPRR